MTFSSRCIVTSPARNPHSDIQRRFFRLVPRLAAFPLVTKPSSPTLPVSRPSLLPPRAFTTEQGRPHVVLYFFICLSIFRGCPRSLSPGQWTAIRRRPTRRTGPASLPRRRRPFRRHLPIGLQPGRGSVDFPLAGARQGQSLPRRCDARPGAV